MGRVFYVNVLVLRQIPIESLCPSLPKTIKEAFRRFRDRDDSRSNTDFYLSHSL
jgi:hypothetical protein